MQIAVADICPNPFRDLRQFPIEDDKVAALVKSIKKTTFWDNILVRPKQGGGYELAYGHHRLAALKKARISTIDVPVRRLSNEEMMRIMANENMTEWAFSASIEQETIKSLVKAYAAGEIELPRPNGRAGHVRCAPSFLESVSRDTDSNSKLYTADTVASFLGWNHERIKNILIALALIEEGDADPDAFAGLSARQARTITEETRRVARETGDRNLARSVSKRLAQGMRQTVRGRDRAGRARNVQDVTIHNARQRTNEMVGSRLPARVRNRPLPPLEKFCEQLSAMFVDRFPTERDKEKLQAIYQHREHLRAQDRRLIVGALRGLAKRAEQWANKIEEN